VRAAVDEMVAEQEQEQEQEQAQEQQDKVSDQRSSSGSRRSLRKLVLEDFLAVIGGGDAQTKEAAKEYQADLAASRRKAAASRSSTYKPGANMPDVAWKPPTQQRGGTDSAAAGEEGEEEGGMDADVADALRAAMSGGGAGGADALAGARLLCTCRHPPSHAHPPNPLILI
jgi:hypothetical protein